MNLIAKHTLNSIRSKPFKTLIVLFILAMSVIMTAFTYEILSALSREEDIRNRSTFDNADIVIQLKNGSSNIIAEKYFEDYLGEDDVISGYYILPFYNERKSAVWGTATDFYDIDEIFGFSFLSFGEIKASEINSAVLVSSDYAEAYGLRVGDKITLTLFDEPISYTVSGISEYPLFGKYDVAVNMQSVINILTSKVSYLAVFDESDFLYSEAYIKLADPSRAEKLREELEDNAYGDFSYMLQSELESYAFDQTILYFIFIVMALLVFSISSILTYSAFRIMLDGRKKQHDAFIMSGVGTDRIVAGFTAEMAVYIVVSSVAGSLLSAGLIAIVKNVLNFTYTTIVLSWEGVLSAVCCEILIGAAVCLVLIRGTKESLHKKEKKYSFVLSAVMFSIAVVAALLMTFLPVRYYCYCAILSGIALIASAAIFLPVFITRCLPDIINKKKLEKGKTCFYYACKNLSAVSELKSVCAMLCVIITAVVGLTVCIMYGYKQYDMSQTFFDCDYIVSNISAEDRAEIEDLEETASLSSFTTIDVRLGSKNAVFISIDDLSFISEEVELRDLPEGNQIVMSESVAKLNGISNGEKITLNVDGKDMEFVVTYNYTNLGYIVFFDNDYVKAGSESVIVRTTSGVSDDYKDKLLRITEGKAAYVDEVGTILEKNYQRAGLFLTAMSVFFWFNLAIAAVGVVNVVRASYYRRQNEFRAFSLCGMSSGEVAKLKAAEMLLLVICAAAVSLITSVAITLYINLSMKSFGYSLLGYSLF